MSDEIEDDYIEPPAIDEFLRSLPRHLSPQARLTMLVFWEDACRQYGPNDITVATVQKLTGLSSGSLQNAIVALRKAGLLTASERTPYCKGWMRFVLPTIGRVRPIQ